MTVESHLAGRIYSGTRAELINYMESVGYQHLPDAFKAIFQMGFSGLGILTPDIITVISNILIPLNIVPNLPFEYLNQGDE